MFLNSTPSGSGLRPTNWRCGHFFGSRLPTLPRHALMDSSTPSSQPGVTFSVMCLLNELSRGRTKHQSSWSKDASSSGPKESTERSFLKRGSEMP